MLASACASKGDAAGPTEADTTPPAVVIEPTQIAAATVVPTATPVPAATPDGALLAEEPPALSTLQGQVVSTIDGSPVADATVAVGESVGVTGDDGAFLLDRVVTGSQFVVTRPAWHPAVLDWPSEPGAVAVELAPRIVKGVRVSRETAGDDERFEDLLELAEDTVVNALVFDTKDETGQVLYETRVPLANETGAAVAVYDPADRLARAKQRELYTITRIVTFADSIWAGSLAAARLSDGWVDASDRASWGYPIALAVEACELGFDEVQFDYVRYPSGDTAAQVRDRVPPSELERTTAIADFLAEARAQLHPLGCAVSAAVFGIVISSVSDERLGQTPEAVSIAVDAVSPMLYPSHYGRGWLGYADPNDHPRRVVAFALDAGSSRMAPNAQLRPWLQGFFYGRKEIRAQIRAADSRGLGWLLWNFYGNYGEDWLPAS